MQLHWTHNDLIPQIRDQECVDLQSANRHVPEIADKIVQPRIVEPVECLIQILPLWVPFDLHFCRVQNVVPLQKSAVVFFR